MKNSVLRQQVQLGAGCIEVACGFAIVPFDGMLRNRKRPEFCRRDFAEASPPKCEDLRFCRQGIQAFCQFSGDRFIELFVAAPVDEMQVGPRDGIFFVQRDRP